MLVYIDTSALAKWYLNEAGSGAFAIWIKQQDDLHISSLKNCRDIMMCHAPKIYEQ